MEDYRAEQQFHEREWTVQRVGWAVLVLLLLLAMAGAFGSGPLAARTISVGDSTIEIDRFVRYNARSQWRIVPGATRSGAEQLRIALDAQFAESYEIASITPEPERMSLSGSELVLEFDARNATGSIVFHVQPNDFGWREGAIRIGDSPPVAVNQLVYP